MKASTVNNKGKIEKNKKVMAGDCIFHLNINGRPIMNALIQKRSYMCH